MTAKTKAHVMDCPVCGEADGAQVGKSAKGFAYAVCDSCGMQLFTRSRFAHERLMMQARDITPEPDPEPTPKPNQPAPQKPAAPKPEPKGAEDDWLI